ncbi:MAG: hypothetical protein AAFW81_07965 [Pseudomonadota bacterium]
MSAKNILLLTSTIAPKAGAHALARTSPDERLADYLCSVDFYFPLVGAGVFDEAVYIDNSGYDLSPIIEKAEHHGVRDRTEFVSYVSELEPAYSRYFLEANLLLDGFERSSVLANAGAAALWKVTGRYVIENIDAIVRKQPAAFDIYFNMRNLPDKVVDFFLVGARAPAFRQLLTTDLEDYRTKNDGEIILRNKVDAGVFDSLHIVPRLTVTPRLTGVRGFDGAAYHSARHVLKHHVRGVANRIAPWLWI